MPSTDTGDIANQTFNDTVFFFPATYVFATIWPVIYLGIVGLTIRQALKSQATNPQYRRGLAHDRDGRQRVAHSRERRMRRGRQTAR